MKHFQNVSKLLSKASIGDLQDGLEGPLELKWGYTQVFGYAQAFGPPTGATHRCLGMFRRLDTQLGLHMGA